MLAFSFRVVSLEAFPFLAHSVASSPPSSPSGSDHDGHGTSGGAKMSRVPKNPAVSARGTPQASLLLRRTSALAGVGRVPVDGESLELDLFSATRLSGAPIGSDLGSEGLAEVNRFVTEARIGRSGMDDLLDAELGKHDYDWLLTPPGTPEAAPLISREDQTPAVVPKRSSTSRSSSTSRASRLSTSRTENDHSVKPARSSSVTRASLSFNRTSVLNTSTSSVTSRPSTPGKRPVTPSTGKSSTPVSRSVPSRSSTPVKTRSTYGSPGPKPELSQNSRPATPTSRSLMPTDANSITSSVLPRSSSRPSTPTRHPIARTTASAPTAGRSASVGRHPTSNGRVPAASSRPSSPSPRPRASVSSAPSSRPSSPNPRPRTTVTSSSSRPSSPNPRPRAPVRPSDLPDFPNDVPPNLRTKLPERPLSAGRARPGMTLTTVHANLSSEVVNPTSSNRRLSLPVVSRSKLPENVLRAPLHSNGHYTNSPENQKPVHSEAGVRRASKPPSSTESTGFGRTISKKSLDMAIKHMDIRQNLGGIRGASIFPHSIRSTVRKGTTLRSSEAIVPVSNDESLSENGSFDGALSGGLNGTGFSSISVSAKSPDRDRLMMERINDLDLYGSYRYDAILMKDDVKHTSWLLSVDDKSDQGSLFDHRFEPPPELFDPL